MTIPKGLEDVLCIDPDVMHGKPCFKGTRVPLAVLMDNLEEGMGLDEFVLEYPTVTREQAQTVVAWEQRNLKQLVGLDVPL
jgi:uncharacterized protein (DUF433 family)